LIQKLTWRQDFGVLAALYGASWLLVLAFGDETLYDRSNPEKPAKPSGLIGRVELLTGVTGARVSGRPSLWTVSKDLLSVAVLPQLLLPSSFPLFR
jgi:hypothetical protein